MLVVEANLELKVRESRREVKRVYEHIAKPIHATIRLLFSDSSRYGWAQIDPVKLVAVDEIWGSLALALIDHVSKSDWNWWKIKKSENNDFVSPPLFKMSAIGSLV